MDNLRRKFIAVFSAYLFIASLGGGAEAINLGTYVKSGSLTASAGEDVKAEILFWSSANENYSVELSAVKVPRGWYVASVPQTFDIGRGVEYPQSEEMLLPGQNAPVAARVMYVVISVPEGEREGTYNVALEAVAGGGSGEISLAQARVFSFKVFVKNPENMAAEGSRGGNSGDFDEAEDAGLPGIAAENAERQKGRGFGETGVRMAFLLLLSAAILYGAWRIYRQG